MAFEGTTPVNSLTVGPDSAGRSVVISATGPYSHGAEVDLVAPGAATTGFVASTGSGGVQLGASDASTILELEPATGTAYAGATLTAPQIRLTGGPVTVTGTLSDGSANLYRPTARASTPILAFVAGQVIVTHGLGVMPGTVVATPNATTTTILYTLMVSAITATTFTLTATSQAIGGTAANPALFAGNLRVAWLASL